MSGIGETVSVMARTRLVNECEKCCISLIPQNQLISSNLPKLAWQNIATDLFEFKQKSYLLIEDYYSRFIKVALLNGTMATMLSNTLKVSL